MRIHTATAELRAAIALGWARAKDYLLGVEAEEDRMPLSHSSVLIPIRDRETCEFGLERIITAKATLYRVRRRRPHSFGAGRILGVALLAFDRAVEIRPWPRSTILFLEVEADTFTEAAQRGAAWIAAARLHERTRSGSRRAMYGSGREASR